MERLFLECAVRAALLVAGTAIVLYAMRVRSAAARHSVWTGVVVVMLALPIWTAWGPKAPLRVLPALAERSASVAMAPPGASAFAPPVPQADSFNLEITARTPQPAAWDWRGVLLGAYLLGLCVFLLRLAIGTVRAQALVRGAVLRDGRLTSASCAVPVTVGWLRPAVILPEEWRGWPQTKLDAVLTHEGEHARRRDPLVQGLALVNRAAFWFHPGAWWLERKLSALAEEACDDVVLARGHSPADYSEYLMDMARAVMRSGARVNVAGMAMPGSRLPQRIRKIIEGGPVARISRTRMTCVVVACTIACTAFAAGRLDRAQPNSVASPAAQSGGLLPLGSARPTFDSVSIKPGTSRIYDLQWPGELRWNRNESSLTATDVTLRSLIHWAYPQLLYAQGRLISGTPGRTRVGWWGDAVPGAPDWTDSARFDIEAKTERRPSPEQSRLMLQSLLEDRFKLAVRYETEVVPIYTLELSEAGRLGPQLRRHVSEWGRSLDGSCWDPANDQPPSSVTGQPTLPYCGGFRIAELNNTLPESQRNATMENLAGYFTEMLDRPVLDRTGLSGTFDFDLVIDRKSRNDLAPFFAALQQQLGLRLVPQNGPVEVFVIDHVERPSEGDGPLAQAASGSSAVSPQARPGAPTLSTAAQRELREALLDPAGNASPLPRPSEQPVIRRIEYRGFKSIDVSVLLERLNERQVGLTVESQLDLTRIRKAEVVIQELLAERGHRLAVVKAKYELVPATNAVWLVFTVDEGPTALGPQGPLPLTLSGVGPAFDTGSIRLNSSGRGPNLRIQPGGLFTATHFTLRELLRAAYQLTPAQSRLISGAPSWIDSHFDIEIRAQGNPDREQTRLMLQSLLADRLKLVVHNETKILPVYALELFETGKIGPALRPRVAGTANSVPQSRFKTGMPAAFVLGVGRPVSMEMIGAYVSGLVDRPVLDRTGLSGFFDFQLNHEHGPTALERSDPMSVLPIGDLSPIFAVLQEQLGLRLVPQNGPVEVLVIDHVEQPVQDSVAGQQPAAN